MSEIERILQIIKNPPPQKRDEVFATPEEIEKRLMMEAYKRRLGITKPAAENKATKRQKEKKSKLAKWTLHLHYRPEDDILKADTLRGLANILMGKRAGFRDKPDHSGWLKKSAEREGIEIKESPETGEVWIDRSEEKKLTKKPPGRPRKDK